MSSIQEWMSAMKQRSKNVSATMLPEEHEVIRQLAFDEHKTISDLVRSILLDSPRYKQALSFLPPVELKNSNTEHARDAQLMTR